MQQKVDELEAGRVSAVTKVGALVILRIEGDILESGSIESFEFQGETIGVSIAAASVPLGFLPALL